MQIQFVGICMFDTSASPVRAFMPNVSAGHVPSAAATKGARAHDAFIAVEPGTVDTSEWGPEPAPQKIPGLDKTGTRKFLIFPLAGVDLSFEPAPTGGSTMVLKSLPRATDAAHGTCPNSNVPRPDLANPSKEFLSVRIAFPGGDWQVFKTDKGLVFSELTVSTGTVIKATSFDGAATRRLKMKNGGPAKIIVANIDTIPPSENDEKDKGLYCALLVPGANPPLLARFARFVSAPMLRALQRKADKKDDFTLGTGCSNSQWP